MIKSIQKTTLIDYPGHVASTLFTGGCCFRCSYCYNKDLVLNPDNVPSLTEEEILQFLSKRKHLIDGIAITGGEPLLHKHIGAFIKEVKQLNLKVKLDTNGYHPDLMMDLINQGLIDFVAMDIKAPLENYHDVCGIQLDISRIKTSISMIMAHAPDYEFRTTIWHNYFNQFNAESLLSPIQSCKTFAIQNFFISPDTNPNPMFKPAHETEIKPVIKLAKSLVKNVKSRGFKTGINTI
ncbi:anaerobic ribonucleoside-triphosphate reductase activating protein [Thermoproteota archaeon]